MEHVIWEDDVPALRDPILVCAFSGWNDAAGAATSALETMASSLEAEPIAHIDPEDFYDFQVNRPTIRMIDGAAREVDWPENAIASALAPGAERDLVLITVAATAQQRSEVIEIVTLFRGKVVDVGPETLVVELSGPDEKLEPFIELMKPFQIKELARTGVIAVARGMQSTKVSSGSTAAGKRTRSINAPAAMSLPPS